jgi:hypothetical protein
MLERSIDPMFAGGVASQGFVEMISLSSKCSLGAVKLSYCSFSFSKKAALETCHAHVNAAI